MQNKKMINKYTSQTGVYVYSTSVVQIPRLYWHKMEGRKDISFGETPFSVADSKVLDCQFGTT